VFSAQIFQENIFLETKPNFSLTRECFPLTNFSNNKQTQEILKNNFSKIILKTNMILNSSILDRRCVQAHGDACRCGVGQHEEMLCFFSISISVEFLV